MQIEQNKLMDKLHIQFNEDIRKKEQDIEKLLQHKDNLKAANKKIIELMGIHKTNKELIALKRKTPY